MSVLPLPVAALLLPLAVLPMGASVTAVVGASVGGLVGASDAAAALSAGMLFVPATEAIEYIST